MPLTKPLVELIVDRMLDIWESADRWTKGSSAIAADGNDVQPDSPYAVGWCATGCQMRALLDLRLSDYLSEFETFMNYYTKEEFTYTSEGGFSLPKYTSVVMFNDADDTTFEDVRLFIKCLKDKEIPDELKGAECTCLDCQNDEAYLEEEECDDGSYL